MDALFSPTWFTIELLKRSRKTRLQKRSEPLAATYLTFNFRQSVMLFKTTFLHFGHLGHSSTLTKHTAMVSNDVVEPDCQSPLQDSEQCRFYFRLRVAYERL